MPAVAAQRAIDAAVQRHLGMDTVRRPPVVRRHRDIRALRTREGATEVLPPIVDARRLQAAQPAAPAP